MTHITLMLTLDLDELTVQHHCDHSDKHMSWRIEHGPISSVDCYLHGTVQQLRAFAAEILRAADSAEEDRS